MTIRNQFNWQSVVPRGEEQQFSQQNVETFLSEMGVMRQHIGDALLTHEIHRDAVREAVGFVRNAIRRLAFQDELGSLRKRTI